MGTWGRTFANQKVMEGLQSDDGAPGNFSVSHVPLSVSQNPSYIFLALSGAQDVSQSGPNLSYALKLHLSLISL